MANKPEPLVTRLLRDAQRYPMLTAEHEREIALAWRHDRDRAALDELVGSHIRLVVKVARTFGGYGLPLADLVAEGNLGLMEAAERFDPERGCRFSSYAIWWIRAAVQEYVLRSWSLVKIGTTAAQKTLFFNLRRLKQKLDRFGSDDLTPETAAAIASHLDVPERDVVEMNGRMSGADSSLNVAVAVDAVGDWLDLLPDERPLPDDVVGDIEERRRRRGLMAAALTTLDLRERDIVAERRFRETPATFEELSQRYAVSRQRVRQIELTAISKMAASVARLGKDSSPALAFAPRVPVLECRASAH